ncbi:paraplegin [Leptopilina heterotoma]|uniref:paraplegin n=1 Tax=Leptopilina heterotoma TaxID=63436 RepID=UPI001CA80029|nr:paraplegin [Leptopilina heterotoma]
MQTLAKFSSRLFVQQKNVVGNSFKHSVQENTFNKDRIFIKSWNNLQICRCLHVTKQSLKHLKKEYQAVCCLLRRSGIDEIFLQKVIKVSRNFSVVTVKCNRQQSSKGEPSESTSSDSSKENTGSSNNEKSDKEPDKDKLIQLILKFSFVIFVQLLVVSVFLNSKSGADETTVQTQVSWNDFVYHMLAKGEVQRIIVDPELELAIIILHPQAIYKGTVSPIQAYQMIIVNPDRFEEKVRAVEDSLGIKAGDGVPISYHRRFGIAYQLISVAILTGIMYMLFRGRKGRSPFSFDVFDQLKRAKFTLVDPLTGSGKGVRFADVAGLKEAKIEIMELVDYLKNPDHYKSLGAKVPKGALLLGPPGCGKTMLAKAVATEANVPFLSINGTEFIEMVGGVGAARVRSLFLDGKKRAPCIIYIDEIDSIGGRRLEGAAAGQGNRESEQTLNQLLVEMDGIGSRSDVIVIASTNRAEVLDKALMRPGRFDRHILIDLPTLSERREIFEQHLKGIKLVKEPSAYSLQLAHMTPGFSGADIANICNEGAIFAARNKKKKVDSNDLLRAIDRVLGGAELKSNSMVKAEKRMIAYRETGRALTAWLLEHTDALLKVSIIPRSKSIGFTQQARGEQYLHSKEKLLDRMCVMLGGSVAENLIFEKCTTGNKDDFKAITKLAYSLVREYGMSSNIGLVSFHPDSLSGPKKPYSKSLGNLIDVEVSRLIADSSKRTNELLSENKEKLQKVAEELLKREVLTYKDIEKLIGPPPFGKKQLVDAADLDTPIDLENSEDPQEPEAPSPQPSPV